MSTPNSVEALLPLVTAIEAETGRRVHLATALRWAQRGSKGVYLETVMLGGRRCTTQRMVQDFLRARTSASSKRVWFRSPTQRSEALERANRFLDREGV
jgi:hypothetical protein